MFDMILPLTKVGIWEIVLLVALLLIFFGAKKIPEMMRGMGRGVKEFKDAVNKDYSKEEESTNDTSAAQTPDAVQTAPKPEPKATTGKKAAAAQPARTPAKRTSAATKKSGETSGAKKSATAGTAKKTQGGKPATAKKPQVKKNPAAKNTAE